MVGIGEIFLEIERTIAKRRLCLLGAEREELRQIVGAADDAHAATASARRCLQDHGVADLLGRLRRGRLVGNNAVRARNRRQAVLRQQRAHRSLALEALEHLGRRADKGKAVRGCSLGECGVLREEAVSRVNSIAPRGERCRDHGRRREVAALGVGWTDADRLVGDEHGARLAVSLAIGDDRLNAELTTGAQDAQRNLATICNEDTLDHHFTSPTVSSRKSSWPYSTGSPVAQRNFATMPPRSARTSTATPSTSTVATSAPFATFPPT